MLVSIKHIQALCTAPSDFDLSGLSDIPVSSALIAKANSAPLPVAFVDMPRGSFVYMTPKGPEYIIIGTSGDMEESLVHELCHYDQFARGDMHMDQYGNVWWKGVKYYLRPIPPAPTEADFKDPNMFAVWFVNMLRYIAQPWEWEAGLPEMEKALGPVLTSKILAAHATYGTVWKDNWNNHTFMRVLVEKRSVEDAFLAVAGKPSA